MYDPSLRVNQNDGEEKSRKGRKASEGKERGRRTGKGGEGKERGRRRGREKEVDVRRKEERKR